MIYRFQQATLDEPYERCPAVGDDFGSQLLMTFIRFGAERETGLLSNRGQHGQELLAAPRVAIRGTSATLDGPNGTAAHARCHHLPEQDCVMPESEADTCRKLVTPKIYAAGWTDGQISEQKTFTDGRIIVVSNRSRRRQRHDQPMMRNAL